LANATSSPSLPHGSTGTETCPSPDVTYVEAQTTSLQNVLVWMPLITPSTRFKLTGLLVQDEFEIYIASLKTKY
jgi:hypothetical protein